MLWKLRFAPCALVLAALAAVFAATPAPATQAAGTSQRPQGPCDIYAAAGDPCVAAHSTTRALYAAYNGALYQVLRQSDGKTLDISVVQPSAADPGGYADAAAQDAFCAQTYCWITTIYDQSPKHNDLTQAPRGGFSGPAMGGFNTLPLADMAPATVLGHKVYGVFIEPGMGLRIDDPKGTAVDDQAEGQYWVINGKHFNSGCCFDYGNAEIDSRDDDNGTMETAYFGDATPWFHGLGDGPWIMTDQENNLVGCVNTDGSKVCRNLETIPWRFVTAIAKGEPHRWTSMGGNAQQGPLAVVFDGQRVNATYAPMRKQGAILLGNGGDNSNSSQGTFYEGAITAANTFPTDATDQQVQANIVAAHYNVAPLSIAPASAIATPPGLQTFTPGSTQETAVTFTNPTDAPLTGVQLSLAAPAGWTATLTGAGDSSKTFSDPIAPGASVTATFKIASSSQPFNGDLVAKAQWTDPAGPHTDSTVEKVRNAPPVKINEFRVTAGPPANHTDSFIELFNAGSEPVDLSNWTLTEHPTEKAIFSAIKIPSGTQLKAGGFYLLGLANSGTAIPARAGDTTLYVRSTEGIKVGDSLTIGSGPQAETRKVARLGTAAAPTTPLWQPLPEGPVITIPAGSTNVPVDNAAGFVVGQKIALGYGATYPAVGRTTEHYEVATVTAVGKAGTQAWLTADAKPGDTNLKVSSVDNITAGDKIRLDIDSVGHGIETVTVTRVGTAGVRTNLAAEANAGDTRVKVRTVQGLHPGDTLNIGTPANRQAVTIVSLGTAGPTGTGIEIKPALTAAHINDEAVTFPGSGLDLAAPLKFSHTDNLPYGDRGTGITFQPATAHPHSSNEPVQALGAGITLDRPLTSDHDIDTPVRDASVTTAGYQGSHVPDEWFGGPVLFTPDVTFGGRTAPVSAGSMILRDPSGIVVDSLNYGLLVDPWAAEGYQGASGPKEKGCRVDAPGALDGFRFGPGAISADTSAGRSPDGADTDSNCADFVTAPSSSLAAPAPRGASTLKVTSVAGFQPGESIRVDAGSNSENATITTVGTPGATTLSRPAPANSTIIPVSGVLGFTSGQAVTLGSGADQEAATVDSTNRHNGTITLTAPTQHAHPAAAPLAGTGLTLSAPLAHQHSANAMVAGSAPTPGAPNHYAKTTH